VSFHGSGSFSVSGFHALPLTCTIDGLAHLVSDDAAAAGVAAGRGTYTALCGHTVHAAALVSSAGRPCARCGLHLDALRAEAGVETSNRRFRRRGGGGGGRRGRLLSYQTTLARSQPDDTALSTATSGFADWLGRWKNSR
jgi:hypothetical protein